MPSPAQTVFCANCGTELTQLANNLQLVDQLARQVELVQQAIKQYENMALNTKGLTGQNWGNALAEIRRINALLAQAKSLSYASSGIEARFARKYGDYKGYLAKDFGEGDMAAKYQQWSEDTNSSVLTTLKAAGLASSQIEGEENAYLAALEQKAATAQGRMQAIQIGNQIAMAGVRQTQKLRQLVLMQTQMLANYIQRESDEKAARAAATRKFLGLPAGTPAGGGAKAF